MKKTTFALLTLFFIAVCGIGFAASWVQSLGDDVTIKETVLAGDKAAAEGVTITTNTRYRELMKDHELYWETKHTLTNDAEGNRVTSQVDLCKREEYTRDNVHTYVNLNVPNDGGYWTKDSGNSLYDCYEGEFSKKMIDDIIARTPAGGVYEGTMKLNAYQDYYPVSLYGNYRDGEIIVDIEHVDDIAYFQIPVPDLDVRQIYASKNEAGEMTKVEIKSINQFFLGASAVAFDGNAYILLSDMHYWKEGDETATSHSYPLPEGYRGIHRVPLQEKQREVDFDGTTSNIDLAVFKDAQCIYPLEEEAGAFRMAQGLQPEELLVFREEDGHVYMTVLDTTIKKVKQDLFLLSHNLVEEDFAYDEKVMTDENHVIITFGTNKICAIESVQGEYQVAMADTVENLDILTTIDEHSAAFAFDEDKLYFAILSEKPDTEFVTGSSYHLFVYEKGKQVFAGFYENSLDYTAELVEDGPTTLAAYQQPIAISLYE